MNSIYDTPCSPMRCNKYVYGERCGNENDCTDYLNYQVAKILRRKEINATNDHKDYLHNRPYDKAAKR